MNWFDTSRVGLFVEGNLPTQTPFEMPCLIVNSEERVICESWREIDYDILHEFARTEIHYQDYVVCLTENDPAVPDSCKRYMLTEEW